MAFQNLPTVTKKIVDWLKANQSLKFPAENFILEERLSSERERSYDQILQLAEGEWNEVHDEYLEEKIRTKGEPCETFTVHFNGNNLLQLEANQSLIRLEELRFPASLEELGLEETVDLLKRARKALDEGHKRNDEAINFNDETAAILERATMFFKKWNQNRDDRPLFCGFYDEVRELFDEGTDQPTFPDWPDRLRDRFGLAHLQPDGEVERIERIPVALFRFDSEWLQARFNQMMPRASIPTVLDGAVNDAFFPAPESNTYGRTIDLSREEDIPDSEYPSLEQEILVERIELTLECLFQVGWIERKYGRDIDTAREAQLLVYGEDLKFSQQLPLSLG